MSVGHQFEWAYLFSEAVSLGLGASFLVKADWLWEFCMRFGYDHKEGGCTVSVTSAGVTLEAEKGWWEQCEMIRAMLRYGFDHGRDDLVPALMQSMKFVRARFVDDEYGGWYDKMASAPTESAPAKGGPFKADYHVTGMCLEGIRCAERVQSSGFSVE